MPQQTILVDLDGVLAEYDGWKGPEHFGKPIVDIVDMVNVLKRMGYTIIIYTTRADEILNGHGARQKTIEWLQGAGVLYDRLVAKPLAVAILDDRAINAIDFRNTPHPFEGETDEGKARAMQFLQAVDALTPLKGSKV